MSGHRLLLAGMAAAILVFDLSWQVGWLDEGRAPDHPDSRDDGEPVRTIDPCYGCGAISMAVAGRLLGRPIPLERAKAALDVDPLGRASMKDMIEAFARLGFSAKGVRLKSLGLRYYKGKPLILFVRPSHFVTVLPIEGEAVVYLDPPNPPVVKTEAKLGRQWNGEALLVRASARELHEMLEAIGIAERN